MKKIIAIIVLAMTLWSCSNEADSKTGTDTANAIELPKNRDVDTVPNSGSSNSGGGDTSSYEGMSGKMQGMDSVSKGVDSSKK